MNWLDFFVIVLVGAGAASGWALLAKGRWRTLAIVWLLTAGLALIAFAATVRADDWDAHFYLAIWMFFAGPLAVGLTLGAVVRGILGWWRNRRN